MYKLIKSIIKRRTKKIPAILKGKGLMWLFKKTENVPIRKEKMRFSAKRQSPKSFCTYKTENSSQHFLSKEGEILTGFGNWMNTCSQNSGRNPR